MEPLINDGLVEEKPSEIGGTQRIYRWKDWGLSLINSPMAHAFPFAWEAAVIKFKDVNGNAFDLSYKTELTSDVEVFDTNKETNEFILRAKELFTKDSAKTFLESEPT
jgi:hypothetical protein